MFSCFSKYSICQTLLLLLVIACASIVVTLIPSIQRSYNNLDDDDDDDFDLSPECKYVRSEYTYHNVMSMASVFPTFKSILNGYGMTDLIFPSHFVFYERKHPLDRRLRSLEDENMNSNCFIEVLPNYIPGYINGGYLITTHHENQLYTNCLRKLPSHISKSNLILDDDNMSIIKRHLLMKKNHSPAFITYVMERFSPLFTDDRTLDVRGNRNIPSHCLDDLPFISQYISNKQQHHHQ